ncbi:formimidoyltetrahydrofolate cyclodeaminase [Mangrovactinospora gilvigrisea]|uniref:Formimidoyltetrahydrofolate cyclodeaminase n=1 Tax=Mangrovactinospora gilvigrisea TaxID=1428644 RepID=A0A1J7C140_9ACTN|nr:cyclodeaminase/cyclohydrolase family protein [Mangrovactinospora gilvigrisea]OIV35280.1 formimidoyltetrahydrofolate cyclodeaminase [Mangrovactinospora gilvigrisea]
MQDTTIGGYLEQLAARVPAPGGGAAAALHAAQAAALIGMVARYSDGPKYAAARPQIRDIREEADALRATALRLAEEDAAAFGAVAEAYGMPRATDEQKSARSAAIGAALAEAAVPPAETAQVAARLVELAAAVLPVGNRNVVTDVGAAASAARAAAETARLNVEVNLAGIRDAGRAATLRDVVDGVDATVTAADDVSAKVRALLRG